MKIMEQNFAQIVPISYVISTPKIGEIGLYFFKPPNTDINPLFLLATTACASYYWIVLLIN